MTRNVHISSSTGKFYDVHSYNVVPWEKRSIPTTCGLCEEMMYPVLDKFDDLRLYVVAVYECRNGHQRTVFIEKEDV